MKEGRVDYKFLDDDELVNYIDCKRLNRRGLLKTIQSLLGNRGLYRKRFLALVTEVNYRGRRIERLSERNNYLKERVSYLEGKVKYWRNKKNKEMGL